MRLKRLQSLTRQGWSVGLRLDPLIPRPGFKALYSEMITRILETVDPAKIHSVTMGPMRLPKAMYDRILHLFPRAPLFALQEMELRNKKMTYDPGTEREMVDHVTATIRNYLPAGKLFAQNPGSSPESR